MADLSSVISDPLMLIFALFVASFTAYFIVELKQIKHKSREEKTFIMFGWSLFILLTAPFLLFTQFASSITGYIASTDISHSPFTYKSLCATNRTGLPPDESADVCRIMSITGHVSYIFAVTGLLLIISSFIYGSRKK